MPNYALYATLPPRVADAITKMRTRLRTQHGLLDSAWATDQPHFTVVYGPKLADGETESKDAANVYPLAQTQLRHPCHAVYRGVSHFIRGDRIIVVIEFENDQLTLLQRAVRDLYPEVDAAYKKAHETDGDQSRAPWPRRWLHITICEFPLSQNNYLTWIHFEDCVRDAAAIFIPSRFPIEGLQMCTATTDTLVSF